MADQYNEVPSLDDSGSNVEPVTEKKKDKKGKKGAGAADADAKVPLDLEKLKIWGPRIFLGLYTLFSIFLPSPPPVLFFLDNHYALCLCVFVG
jgi:hypothetical protein